MIDDNCGTGWKQEALDIYDQPEDVGYGRDGRCHWLGVKHDAVENKDGVGDLADESAHVAEHQISVHLVHRSAEGLVTSTERLARQ